MILLYYFCAFFFTYWPIIEELGKRGKKYEKIA